MSSLYVYDFGDGARRIVDDSGERWTPVEFLQWDVTTVFCEVCHSEVTNAIENQHGIIMCWDCFDVQHIDLTEQEGLLLDRGLGHYEHVAAVNVVERHTDGDVVIDFGGDRTRWCEIMIDGYLYGYSYEGEIE